MIIIAEGIRQDKSGIHAGLTIGLDSTLLAYTNCNIERDEERTRLINKAFTYLEPDIQKQCNKKEIEHQCAIFSKNLWKAFVNTYLPEDMEGSSEQLPLRFVLKPYIVEGGGTILYAPPGKGKSYTGLLWAISVDAGIEKFWLVSQAKTLFINLERSRYSVQRRLGAANRILGLDPKRKLLILNARGKALQDIAPNLKASIKTNDVKFIVLDSISRAGFGDLTENRPVTQIIDTLSSLCNTWLALAHTPRGDASHIYGSIHFEAGADIMVQLLTEVSDEQTLGVGWQITKQNDIPQFPIQVFAYQFDDLGLINVRQADKTEFPDIMSHERTTTIQDIRRFIFECDPPEATATQIADGLTIDRPKLVKILKHSGYFHERRKDGRNVYYGIGKASNA